jgi:hypothetical protein
MGSSNPSFHSRRADGVPENWPPEGDAITLRDLFAGLAMLGMMSDLGTATDSELSEYSYKLADTMLDKRQE